MNGKQSKLYKLKLGFMLENFKMKERRNNEGIT